MRLLTLSFLLFTGTGLCAQSTFQRVIDCSSYGDMVAADRVGDGSYWAYNFYDNEFGYHSLVGVVKYGADHEPVWNKVYQAPSADVGLDLYDLTTTTDGGLVWVGSRTGGLNDTAVVVKLTGAGDVAWSTGIPPFAPAGASAGTTAQLTSVDEAPNGDVIVAGYFSYFIGTSSFRRAIAARISTTGTVQWTRSYALPVAQGTLNYAYDVHALSGGGILLLGFNTVDGTWLARLQDNGTVVWAKGYSTVNGFDALGPLDVLPTSSGFNIFIQGDPYAGELTCVMHTNATGEIQSTTKYRMPEGYGQMFGVRALPDGRYLIASGTNLTGQYQGGNAHLLVVGADDIPTLSASFGVPTEGEYARAVLPSADGGYVLGGGAVYENLDEHRGGIPSRPYLVGTDAAGSYICGDPVQIILSDTVFTSAVRTLDVESITGWANATITSTSWLNSVNVCHTVGIAEVDEHAFMLSPNPASDQLTIQPSDLQAWDHVLFDATGRVVLTHPRTIGRVQLDLRTLAPGRYVLLSAGASTVRSSAVMVGR